jgi:UDP-glucose 4-epimerase
VRYAEKNVLVTGASTAVGERVIRRLLDDSRVDQILAVTTESAPLTIPEGDRLRAVPVDLRRSRRVHSLLFGPAREMNINVVVHTAMEPSATKEGSSVHAFNVDALRSIMELSERHPSVRRLVIRSAAEVYQVRNNLPVLIAEDHILNMSPGAPQWVRDRVEADLTACARMALSPLQIVVMRMAEILAPGTGSQLFDYLQSPICFRPAGYDPMLNLMTLEDTAAALQRAIHHDDQGVFNIPGADTLPLTACIRKWGRIGLPAPDGLIRPLYRLRNRMTGHDFRYGMNRRRFHYSCVLDGGRAARVLGYIPSHPISWPASGPEIT